MKGGNYKRKSKMKKGKISRGGKNKKREMKGTDKGNVRTCANIS